MPVDYSLGKIYKIVGNGKVYVGSTCEPLLCRRLAGHKRHYKFWLNEKGLYITSFECLEDPECKIELLEMCPCSCVDELRKCERKWIEEIDCVNRCIAGRTKKEYANSDQGKTLQKKHKKTHYEANKEAIKEKMKEHYEANKEAIKEKARERYWKKKAEK